MTREKFIKNILKYLKRIPKEERDEIESYYNELLDDAGIGYD